MKREQVLIIKYTELPQEIKDELRKHSNFHNDTMLEHYSELTYIENGKDLSNFITMDRIKDYHRDQTETNGYTGTLKEFISDYGLVIDEWLISASVDLTGIVRILFNISW